jgi:hypothetical protein
MTPLDTRRDMKRDLLIAGALIAAGLTITAVSFAQIAATNGTPRIAQATQPLQSTPGAESKPSAPSEPTTTGTGSRPAEVSPEPARPDSEAQDAGAKPALPPAPAEKTGEPIQPK